MKNLIVLIALVASFTASARSILPAQMTLGANLETINLDEDSYLNKMNVFGGRVEVELIQNEINLMLHYQPECREHFACTMVLKAHEIKLPIVDKVTDECNNVHYIARRDMRPVDGALEEIVVSDHRFNRCPTFVALPATGITYESSFYDMRNGEEVSTHSTFTAEGLEMTYGPF